MIKKWIAGMAFGSTCLSGCVSAGLYSHGESASYSFWNNSGEVVGNIVTVGIYADNKKRYFDSASRSEPVRRHAQLGQPIHGFMGGHQMMADTGHKVPEEVEVSWRKMPPPSDNPYVGEQIGPFRVKVRSRIPEEALKLARREGYSIGIRFSVGKEPVMLCWGVVAPESDFRGRSTIMAGGQCSPPDVAWRKDIDWRKPGVWFPENQPVLPGGSTNNVWNFYQTYQAAANDPKYYIGMTGNRN